MTRPEFKEIAIILATVYMDRKSYFNNPDVLGIWYDMLSDIDYKIVKEATKRYIKTHKSPPTIAEVREECQKVTDRIGEVRRELLNIYDRTRGIYPGSTDDDETKRIWWNMVTVGVPLEERIAKAEALETEVNAYVRNVERGSLESIPSISEFLRGKR